MMKRLIDLVFAMAGLILLSPVFAVVAVVIRLRSPGPVFYRGVRVGRYGKSFRMLKFRTMVVNAEALGGSCTSTDDRRITPVGQSLRKYKLDELPQLFNVVRGDMSLVGPRPEVQDYTDLFNEEERQILSIRPGITDWATLSNSDEEAALTGSPDPERTYLEQIRPQKIRLQLKYVRERNLCMDTRILLATVMLVVRRCFGAESAERSAMQHSMSKE